MLSTLASSRRTTSVTLGSVNMSAVEIRRPSTVLPLSNNQPPQLCPACAPVWYSLHSGRETQPIQYAHQYTLKVRCTVYCYMFSSNKAGIDSVEPISSSRAGRSGGCTFSSPCQWQGFSKQASRQEPKVMRQMAPHINLPRVSPPWHLLRKARGEGVTRYAVAMRGNHLPPVAGSCAQLDFYTVGHNTRNGGRVVGVRDNRYSIYSATATRHYGCHSSRRRECFAVDVKCTWFHGRCCRADVPLVARPWKRDQCHARLWELLKSCVGHVFIGIICRQARSQSRILHASSQSPRTHVCRTPLQTNPRHQWGAGQAGKSASWRGAVGGEGGGETEHAFEG